MKPPITLTLGVSVLTLAMAGCTTTQTRDQQFAQLEKENAELKSALENREGELQMSEQKVAALAAQSEELLPPNAKAGECYARLWAPATYRDVGKKVLVKEAGEKIETVPAKYEWGSEKVLVKEASSKLVPVPAKYGSKTEKLLVKAAERVWQVNLKKDGAPATPALLATAKEHGIDLDAATPGMCFHEHYRPAQYKTENQQVLLSEASAKVSTDASKYRTEEKKVLVKEASTKIVDVPAVYETVSEQVVDVPAHTIWKKGTGPIQKIDEATGEIMCLVEVPATYKTIEKRVIKSPATTKVVEIPAVYETVKVRVLADDAAETRTDIPAEYGTVKVTKKVADASFVWHEIHNLEEPPTTRTGNQICLVEKPAQYKTVTTRTLVSPATTKKVEIPAEYKTVKVRKLASAASEKRTAIPAVYKTVTVKELLKDGRMEWRSILCETNMTGTRISQIQTALKKAGYDPGPIDGVVGRETMQAVNAFQRANDLPVDRHLNLATLKALGVSPK